MGFRFPHTAETLFRSFGAEQEVHTQLEHENQVAIEDYLDGLDIDSAIFFESDDLDDNVSRDSTWEIPGPNGFYLAVMTAQLGVGGGIVTGDEVWLVVNGNAWRSGEAVGSVNTQSVTAFLLLQPNVDNDISVYWTGTSDTHNVTVSGGAIKITQ